ncbi:bifunctional nuclease family protein [uncultured Bacteroides sp.]|uniref:bifunctional nuclease family protein n=1 Tax=uncultured Bacteroides sp. TaxID=162156 RepID=UPI0025EEC601|nr:bifunctional nuclease family protein [uncultured Bacteroides sp.]
MNRKKIELHVQSISSSQAQAGAYALVLSEVNGQRELPVIIGSSEAQYLLIEMKGIVPPRPLTHTLFASVLEVLGVSLLRVLIHKVDNGIFHAYLYLKTNDAVLRIDARTSDAVALALCMNAPIFVYDDILEAECLKAEHRTTPNREVKSNENALTRKNTLKQLEAALQNAIDKEEYERAAQLRDMISQYKKQ